MKKSLQIGVLAVLIALIFGFGYRQVTDTLARDDKVAWAHYHEARKLKQAGRLGEAEAKLKRAIATSVSDDAEFYRALGFHYSATRRYIEGVEYYDEAIARKPELEQHLLRPIAWCYLQAGDAKNADRRMVRLQQNFPAMYKAKDQAFHQSVKYELQLGSSGEKARVALDIVLSAEVGAVDAVQVAGSWDADGKYSEAYGYRVEPAKKTDPGHYQLRVELEKYSVLPYQVVVTSSSGRPLGFERFRVNPEANGTQFVTVGTRRNLGFAALRGQSRLQRRAATADGKKRIFILWPDSGSWWLFRSLIGRGLAPNVADMIAQGTRGQMISEPPITSIAMQRITAFVAEPSLMDAFWLQLKGIQALDDYIEVEQKKDSLASRLKAQNRTMVDLTFNEPWLGNEGDQAKDLGFSDDHTQYDGKLTKDEISKDSVLHRYLDIAAMKTLVGESQRHQRWALATQWDDSQDKFTKAMGVWNGADGPDVMLLRLPAVDVLSHMFFENTDAYSEQNMVLEGLYVFVDDLIGQIRSQMDADDTLLLISDHGAKNNLSHDPISMIIGEGPAFAANATFPSFLIERFPHLVMALIAGDSVPPGTLSAATP